MSDTRKTPQQVAIEVLPCTCATSRELYKILNIRSLESGRLSSHEQRGGHFAGKG